MSKVRLIRHAESTFNRHGSKDNDVPITDRGKDQAKSLEGEYDIVVCSTLKRAIQTLHNSNLKYKKVIFTPICREVMDTNPTNYYPGEDITHESSEDVKKRMTEFREFLKSLDPDNNKIAVITHSVFLNRLTSFWFQNAHWMNWKP